MDPHSAESAESPRKQLEDTRSNCCPLSQVAASTISILTSPYRDFLTP